MRRFRSVSVFAFASFAVPSFTAGCGSSNNSSGFSPASPTRPRTGGMEEEATTGPGDSSLFGDTSGSCSGATRCDGGVCVSGKCCSGARRVRHLVLHAAAVCLFNACVTPGAPCETSDQCPMGQYCEPALGGANDAGAPPRRTRAARSRCRPRAAACRCPPTCPGDAGVAAPTAAAASSPASTTRPAAASSAPSSKWTVGRPDGHRVPNFDRRLVHADRRRASTTPTATARSTTSTRRSSSSCPATHRRDTGKGACCQCTNTTPTHVPQRRAAHARRLERPGDLDARQGQRRARSASRGSRPPSATSTTTARSTSSRSPARATSSWSIASAT